MFLIARFINQYVHLVSAFEIGNPDNLLGTDYVPILVSSDSSDSSADLYTSSDGRRLHKELWKEKREHKNTMHY